MVRSAPAPRIQCMPPPRESKHAQLAKHDDEKTRCPKIAKSAPHLRMLHVEPTLDGETKLLFVLLSLAFFGLLFTLAMSLIADPENSQVKQKIEGARRASVAAAGNGKGAYNNVLTPEVQQSLETVAKRLKVPIAQVHAYWLSFIHYDVDHSGSVSATEIKKMLDNSIGFVPSDEEIEELVREVDFDGSGTLEFYEFCVLAARLDFGEQTDEELHDAFMLWSGDETSIPRETLKHALTKLGNKFNDAEFEAFMGEGESRLDVLPPGSPCFPVPVGRRPENACARRTDRLCALVCAMRAPAVDMDKDGTVDYQEYRRAMKS